MLKEYIEYQYLLRLKKPMKRLFITTVFYFIASAVIFAHAENQTISDKLYEEIITKLQKKEKEYGESVTYEDIDRAIFDALPKNFFDDLSADKDSTISKKLSQEQKYYTIAKFFHNIYEFFRIEFDTHSILKKSQLYKKFIKDEGQEHDRLQKEIQAEYNKKTELENKKKEALGIERSLDEENKRLNEEIIRLKEEISKR